MYSSVHFLIYILGMLLSAVLYGNFILHTLYLIILYTIIFWNGGTYYVDHFSKQY